ncbi:MAG: glycerate kinase [Actinobacteria bacterium]|nr:glycerate kinase [Actinomycetota bacterium]
MRIVVAPDKFRGTVTATECANAIAAPLRARGHEVIVRPMADGGEGTLVALGGANRRTVVSGPLGDPVEAGWRLSAGSAVIEMAAASGLSIVGGADGNDAVAASTHGTGELIAAALDLGASDIVVGVGGSATTDGGLGALRAVYPVHRLRGVRLTVACDVRTTFVDAASVFAPQKGASPAQVQLLGRRLERLVQAYLDEYGVDVSTMTGSGAGGGLAGGLACVGGELVEGFDLVAERLDLDADVERADLVITGEGLLDAESFDGKVVGGVVDMARHFGVPVVAVVGESFDGADDRVPTLSLTGRFGRERAIADTVALLSEAATELVGLAQTGS